MTQIESAEQNSDIDDDKHSSNNTLGAILAGTAASESARRSAQEAARTFAKSAEYDRSAYKGAGKAIRTVKEADFAEAAKNGSAVRDPYTGDELFLRKQESKAAYGADWQKHLAEGDHKRPLAKIHEDTKSNPWIKESDVDEIANSPDNMQTVSREFNNAKRSRTNKEFVRDDEYLKKTGVELSEKAKQKAEAEGLKAQRFVNRKVAAVSVKNAAITGHRAGVEGLKSAGATAAALSVTKNVVALLKGEKTADEAAADIALDTAKAGATGYVMAGGLALVEHTLSSSSLPLVQSLLKSNALGGIATAVLAVGDTFSRLANGDIDGEECLAELGEKGKDMACSTMAMTVGQATIPIPVVGAVVGSLVGYALSASCTELLNSLKEAKLAREERIRIERECAEAIALTKQYRAEIEAVISDYLSDHIITFNNAFEQMNRAIGLDDIDGFMAGANAITEKLGGTVRFANFAEFDAFMQTGAPLRL